VDRGSGRGRLRAAGATWLHPYTDTDTETGPDFLYRRLGFDDAGRVTDFVGT